MSNISVVIPTYNSSMFIREAICSALNQTVIPSEILVIDDGSTDDTKKNIENFGDKIKYFYQENSGSGKARNRGINESKGDFIAFLDSDDFWDKNHLEDLINALTKDKNAALAYCGKKWVDKDGKPIINSNFQDKYPTGWIFNDLFNSNYISSASVVMVRKEALTKVGGFRESNELRNAQDYDLWLRLSANNEIASIEKKNVNYRRHDKNKTLATFSRQKGLMYALKHAGNMVRNGQVDKKNSPRKIDVDKRIKKQYKSAIISLFYVGQYSESKSFVHKSFNDGYFSIVFLPQAFLSLLPVSIILFLRKIKKNIRF